MIFPKATVLATLGLATVPSGSVWAQHRDNLSPHKKYVDRRAARRQRVLNDEVGKQPPRRDGKSSPHTNKDVARRAVRRQRVLKKVGKATKSAKSTVAAPIPYPAVMVSDDIEPVMVSNDENSSAESLGVEEGLSGVLLESDDIEEVMGTNEEAGSDGLSDVDEGTALKKYVYGQAPPPDDYFFIQTHLIFNADSIIVLDDGTLVEPYGVYGDFFVREVVCCETIAKDDGGEDLRIHSKTDTCEKEAAEECKIEDTYYETLYEDLPMNLNAADIADKKWVFAPNGSEMHYRFVYRSGDSFDYENDGTVFDLESIGPEIIDLESINDYFNTLKDACPSIVTECESPTAAPTAITTMSPTAGPTAITTMNPTAGPTAITTMNPTDSPTAFPTDSAVMGTSEEAGSEGASGVEEAGSDGASGVDCGLVGTFLEAVGVLMGTNEDDGSDGASGVDEGLSEVMDFPTTHLKTVYQNNGEHGVHAKFSFVSIQDRGNGTLAEAYKQYHFFDSFLRKVVYCEPITRKEDGVELRRIWSASTVCDHGTSDCKVEDDSWVHFEDLPMNPADLLIGSASKLRYNQNLYYGFPGEPDRSDFENDEKYQESIENYQTNILPVVLPVVENYWNTINDACPPPPIPDTDSCFDLWEDCEEDKDWCLGGNFAGEKLQDDSQSLAEHTLACLATCGNVGVGPCRSSI